MMGDVIQATPGRRTSFTVHVSGVMGAKISIVEDGQKIALLTDASISFDDERKTFALRLDSKRHWIRADVRDAEGRLLLVGNPIYVNYRGDNEVD